MRFTRPLRFTLLAISIALNLASVTPSHADDNSDNNDPKKAKTLDEVAVKASAAPKGSIAEQRDADSVSTVMSKQDITAVPAANIADVLSHLPGLSSYTDMQLGQAATGENGYVSIRGLNASYNAYSLNGFAMPETDPSTRAISLDMLSPFGVQSVLVSKAPTPDMRGDSIGGTIDMRTPSAFDFDKDVYARTTVQGRMNSVASDLNLPDKGGVVQQEFATRFGEQKNLGLYMAAYYGKNNNAAETTAPNAEYTPANPALANAQSLRGIDDLVDSQYKYSIFTNQIKRYGINTSLDWHGDDTSLYARALYSVYDVTGEQNQASARQQTPTTILRGDYFDTRDMDQKLGTLQLGGSSALNRLNLDYGLSWGYGTQDIPNYVQASLYGPGETGQFGFNLSNPAYPSIAGDPAAVRNYFYNLNSDAFWKVQGEDSGSRDTRINAHVDGSWAINEGGLQDIKFGLSADTSKRNAYDHPFFHDNNNFVYGGTYFGGPNYPYNAPGGPSLGSLPGVTVYNAFGGNFPGPFKLINRDWILAQAVPYKYVNDPNGAGDYTENDYNANTTSSRENIYAGYFMGTLQYDELSILPGVRYELTDYSANSWLSDGNDSTGNFVGNHRNYGEVLPGISLNYRPDDETVYRASLRRSFSRPAFGLLSGPTTYSVDDVTGKLIGISAPNPNLEPTTADNFDMSAEFYDDAGGLFTASAYTKWIHKFVYTSESSDSVSNTLGGIVPTGVTTINGVPVTMPENGGSAQLHGIELAARKQFVSLPAAWSHFGIAANLTLQRSSADSGRADHAGYDTWLPNAPQIMYNADLFYDDSRFRADLTYNYTGLQLIALTSDGLDQYLQPVQMLSLNANWKLPGGFAVGVAVRNLLDKATFWETEGKSKRYLAYDPGADGAYVDTGRLYMVTLSYTY